MNIELHIEQLTLDRCAHGNCEWVGDAVGRELQFLSAAKELSSSPLNGTDIWQIGGKGFKFEPGGALQHVGNAIAQAINEQKRHE
jgi:hypothetical protein